MRGNSILSKLRYYLNKEILRTIYFTIFHSYLTYITTVCGQTRISQKHITVLQKKELRSMNFAPFNSHSSSYFHNCKILKFCDIINIEACASINSVLIVTLFQNLLKDLKFYVMLTTLGHPVKTYILNQPIIPHDLEENQ